MSILVEGSIWGANWVYENERSIEKKRGAKQTSRSRNLVQIAPPGMASLTNPLAITSGFVAIPAKVVIKEPRKP